MRYHSEHKAETRRRILRSAARDLRRKGPDRVAVAEVMAAAGLTHGAFYAHFASKDALVSAAVDAMFGDAQRHASGLEDALAQGPEDVRAALRAYLEGYLSPEHRDGPDRGCPLPALAVDMARSEGEARHNFARGLKAMTARIENALAGLDNADPVAEAHVVVAQMVGAVALARATGPSAESDAILTSSRDALLTRLDL